MSNTRIIKKKCMILVLNPFKIKNGIVLKLNLLGTKKSKKKKILFYSIPSSCGTK